MAAFDIPIDTLQNSDHERRNLSCAKLSLSDRVPAIQDRLDATLLDRTRLLEDVRADVTQQILVEVVIIEQSREHLPIFS